MPVTVAMIEEKEFKIKMRGYDPTEVDEFLDAICDEMEAMEGEISNLQARLNQAMQAAPYASSAVPVPPPMAVPRQTGRPVPQPAVQPVPQAVPQPAAAQPASSPEEDKATAQRMMARLQKLYDETIAEAKAEAAKILENAHVQADSGMEALQEEKKALENEVAMLRAAAKDYRERFQRLLDDQRHVLNAEKALFD